MYRLVKFTNSSVAHIDVCFNRAPAFERGQLSSLFSHYKCFGEG